MPLLEDDPEQSSAGLLPAPGFLQRGPARPGEEDAPLLPTLDLSLFSLLVWSHFAATRVAAAAASWLSAPAWEALAWHLPRLQATRAGTPEPSHAPPQGSFLARVLVPLLRRPRCSCPSQTCRQRRDWSSERCEGARRGGSPPEAEYRRIRGGRQPRARSCRVPWPSAQGLLLFLAVDVLYVRSALAGPWLCTPCSSCPALLMVSL